MRFLLLLVIAWMPIGAAGAAAAPWAPQLAPVPVPLSEQFTLHSTTLGRSYAISVRLPPGYNEPRNLMRRYPLVVFNDSPYSFPLITGVAHLPMGAGQLEELILVGIGYAQGMGSRSRILDYTPTVNPANPEKTGGAQAYVEFMAHELLPTLEKRYRANPARRALAGHSYGGLFAAYVLLTRPELFQHYIVSSPSLWFHQNVMWKVERISAASHRDLKASVYMGIGSLERPPRGSRYDMVADVKTFESALRSRHYPGLDLRVKVFEGATHETVVPSVMLNGLLWHFAKDRDNGYGY